MTYLCIAALAMTAWISFRLGYKRGHRRGCLIGFNASTEISQPMIDRAQEAALAARDEMDRARRTLRKRST